MKTQMRFQKILMLVSLVVAALTFVFALFFLTGSLGYATKYVTDAADPINARAFVDASQGYVKTLVALAIVFIVIVAFMFITSCQSRRNYYITNYIAIGLFVAFALVMTVYIIIMVSSSMNLFLNDINWDAVPDRVAALGGLYPLDKGEKYPFIIGYVVAVLVLVDAALVVLSTVWKTLLMKGEKKLLEGSKNVQAEEVA